MLLVQLLLLLRSFYYKFSNLHLDETNLSFFPDLNCFLKKLYIFPLPFNKSHVIATVLLPVSNFNSIARMLLIAFKSLSERVFQQLKPRPQSNQETCKIPLVPAPYLRFQRDQISFRGNRGQ